MSPDGVAVTRAAEGVVTITLDAPERRNAFTVAMAETFVERLTRVENDGTRAVVITGAPPAFCAGADRSVLATARESDILAVYQVFLRVARTPLVTVGAINGPAVGAGLNLALACDLRLGTSESMFDSRFLRLGIHPGGGHAWLLAAAVGPQVAAELVLIGERFGAERSREVGLLSKIVASDELVPRAVELASSAAAVDAELLRRAKHTLRMTPSMSHEDALQHEFVEQAWSLQRRSSASS